MTDKYILNGHEVVPVDDLLEWGRWLQTADRDIALAHSAFKTMGITLRGGIAPKSYDPSAA